MATLVPVSPLRYLAANSPTTGAKCRDGLTAMVTRLGRETVMLELAPDGSPPDVLRMRIGLDAFRGGLPNPESSWYSDDFAALGGGTLMLVYQQLQDEQTHLFSSYPVIWNGEVRPLIGKTVKLCVDRRSVRTVGGWEYWSARSLDRLH